MTCQYSSICIEEETQPDAVTSQQEQQKTERGEKTAENVRYGQTVSEQGMGGKTTEAGGSANQGEGGLRMMFCDQGGNAKQYYRRLRRNGCTGRNR